ncbi:MAG: serine hydroxymethyltransferase [Candidatus Kerfeldbacteria bacterium]|nr:serine hydroxymethyltransferase [Candidatus Kerfeldbacteria bacterium]
MEIERQDPELAALLTQELARQRSVLGLIPSENIVSEAVLDAIGSVLTNKYAEGYPGKRYYAGNAVVDDVETLAIDRAKKLFGADHANVQPLSGAPANLAVYSALLKPGDTVLGMDLTHGGHLTHGHPVTFPAKIYGFVRYGTTTDGLIDFDQVRALAQQHRPKLILCGYSSYSRDLDYAAFKQIADEVGALTMADISHTAGLVVAGEMNNPVPLFDVVTTTTHKTLRGPRGGLILCTERFAKQIDKAVFPGLQGGPHMNLIAAKAAAFGEALQPAFRDYAKQVKTNAKSLETALRARGFTIVFGTTENHLLLLDGTGHGWTGTAAQDALERAGLVVNKNVIPNDPHPPTDPSGIRIGSPLLTSRGMKEAEMTDVAALLADVLEKLGDDATIAAVADKTAALAERFPIYPDRTR